MWGEIQKEQQGTVTVLRLRGSWELERHFELREILEELRDASQPRVILNLKDVEHLSSSIMGAIIGFRQEVARSGGRVALAELSQTASLTVRLLRLEDFFDIYETEQGALEALESTPEG